MTFFFLAVIAWLVVACLLCSYYLIEPTTSGSVDGMWRRHLHAEQFQGIRKKMYWWAYKRADGLPELLGMLGTFIIIMAPIIFGIWIFVSHAQ